MKQKHLNRFLLFFICFLLTTTTIAQLVSFSNDSVINQGNKLSAIAIDHFNGDEFPDLAVLDDFFGNRVSIFLNNGNGVFPTTADSTYRVSNRPSYLTSGHINADNFPDLISTSREDSSIIIWYGNGDGTFGNRDSLKTPIECTYASIADLNKDSKMDMAVVEDGNLLIYLGNGDGTFQTPSVYASSGSSWDIEIADMNNDTYPDIMVSSGGTDEVVVHYNDKMGDFSDTRYIAAPRTPWFLGIADFNGDNYLDISAGSGSWEDNNTFLLINDSTGGFNSSPTTSPSSYVRDATAADLNNDAKPDIMVIDDNGIYAVLGDGAGGLGQIDSIVYDAGNFDGELVQVADLNMDNKADLIVGRERQVSIYYNTGVITSIPRLEGAGYLDLKQSYPNPFKERTSISFQLDQASKVELSIYNTAGQQISTLLDKWMPIGEYSIPFYGKLLPSGIYFYEMTANGIKQVKKMILLR